VSAARAPEQRDARVGDLFPAPVRAATTRLDADLSALFDEEKPAVSRAVAKRQREFASGRRCARALLAELGHPPLAIPRRADRSPEWPAGVVGSISHCDDLCFVALAPASALLGIGVDVEPDQPLEMPLWKRICTPAELAGVVAASPPALQGHTVRLLFSAKEAFYKSVFPLLREVLGFQAVEIQLDWDTGRFHCAVADALRARLPGERTPEGRFVRRDGWVFTGATLAAVPAEARSL
jgi:4'-phosphopantetheinyl transferase EntD